MAKKSVSQTTKEPRRAFVWIDLRAKAKAGTLTEEEERTFSRINGHHDNNAQSLLIQICIIRGIATSEELEFLKWNKGLNADLLIACFLGRVAGNTILEDLQPWTPTKGKRMPSLSEEYHAARRQLITALYHSMTAHWLEYLLAVAEHNDKEARVLLKVYPEFSTYSPIGSDAQESTPKNDALSRSATPTTRRSDPFLDMLDRIIESKKKEAEAEEHRRMGLSAPTKKDPEPLPDGVALANLVEFALNHDLALLGG